MGRHSYREDPKPLMSRRGFARSALVAAPVLVLADQLAAAGPADAAASGGWSVTGNAGTVPASNYLGTTDAQPVVFRTGGVERMRLAASGQVGVGTAAPVAGVDARAAAGQPAVQGVYSGTSVYAGVRGASSSPAANAAGVSGVLNPAKGPGAGSAGVLGTVQFGGTTMLGSGVSGHHTSQGFGVVGHTDAAGTGVYGYTDGAGTGVLGDTSSGVGVQGYSDGAGIGVNGYVAGAGDGVRGGTGAYDGLAGYFANANLSSGSNPQTGTAVRALAGHGTYQQLRSTPTSPNQQPDYVLPAGFAAVEAVGAYGVIAAATTDSSANDPDGQPWSGAGVLGLGPSGQHGFGVVGSGRIGVLGASSDYVAVYGDGGVYGVAGYGADTGVYGYGPTGVEGFGLSTGCYASAFSSSTQEPVYGLFAVSSGGGAGSAAIRAQGDVQVQGTLSKSGGSFRIDHPDDPANRYLSHSFVESPDMMNVYNGIVTLDGHGAATVTMPSWFEGLNRDFRYQLTALGSAGPNLHIAAEMQAGTFRIGGGESGQRVSWQVTGIRQDAWARANRIPVESDKPAAFRGTYLHPELFDQPVQRREGYREPVGAPSRR